MLPCPIKHFTGVDCLGCGIQRSLKLLFEFNIIDSFKMYPPLIIGILLTLVFCILTFGLNTNLKINTLVKGILTTVIINYIVKLVII
jgi:Protein of unknown function (DUF2752).